jgi:hypothetical protein
VPEHPCLLLPRSYSPGQAARILIVRLEKQYRAEERLAIEQMKRVHLRIERSASVLEEFARILRDRKESKEGAEKNAGQLHKHTDGNVPVTLTSRCSGLSN